MKNPTLFSQVVKQLVKTVMRRNLLLTLLSFFVLVAPAWGAIAFVQNPTVGTSAASPCASGSATWTATNAIVAGFGSSNGATAVTGITASTDTFFALPGAISNSSPGHEVHVAAGIAGGSYTLSLAVSSASNMVCGGDEYSGVSGFGVQKNSAPATLTNPSISLTTTAPNSWCVAIFSSNDTNAFTGVRWSGSLTNTTTAMADSGPVTSVGGTCTVSVTHVSASIGMGIVELLAGTTQIGNGVLSLGGGGGPNGYLNGFANNLDAVTGTTGAASNGYTGAVLCLITNDAGNTGNIRGGIYTDASGLPSALVTNSDTGSTAFGIPAGSGTANLHCLAFGGSVTLAKSTPFWPTWNNDTTNIAMRVDSTTCAAGGTTDEFIAFTYAAMPGTFGSSASETCGPHMWAEMYATAGGGSRGLFRPAEPVTGAGVGGSFFRTTPP